MLFASVINTCSLRFLVVLYTHSVSDINNSSAGIIMYYKYINTFYLTVATISFNESAYTVNENEGQVQPVIVLSNPSSTDVTVRVTDGEGTATG